MTRKDYIAIAQVLNSNNPGGDPETTQLYEAIVLQLADCFEFDNKLFDRAKFLKACNVKLDEL